MGNRGVPVGVVGVGVAGVALGILFLRHPGRPTFRPGQAAFDTKLNVQITVVSVASGPPWVYNVATNDSMLNGMGIYEYQLAQADMKAVPGAMAAMTRVVRI